MWFTIAHLVVSGNGVINDNPPSVVFLLEGELADLVVLQHDCCSLTVIPAWPKLTSVSILRLLKTLPDCAWNVVNVEGFGWVVLNLIEEQGVCHGQVILVRASGGGGCRGTV